MLKVLSQDEKYIQALYKVSHEILTHSFQGNIMTSTITGNRLSLKISDKV